MAMLMASSSESFSARGSLASRSVSALGVSVLRGAGACCAKRVVAVSNAIRIVINRRTAVMQVLPDTPLVRKDEVMVSNYRADMAGAVLEQSHLRLFPEKLGPNPPAAQL